jgi:hypothetical protein
MTKKTPVVLEPNVNLYAANLDLFGKPIANILKDHPEKPVAIDEVKLEGLNNPGFLFFIGFSTTRLLELALRSKKEITYICIIEPDVGRFHALMKREYLEKIEKNKNIDLVLGMGPDVLVTELYDLFAKNDPGMGLKASRAQCVEFVIDPFAYPFTNGKIHPDAQAIIDCVTKASHQIFLAMGCSADSFSRWEQVIRNEKNIFNSWNINSIFGAFEDVPAIVVGAGPSTEDFIKAAKEQGLDKKSVIISCDASLKLLIDNGIRPHFVVRCERKLTTIFNGVKREDTNGIYYAPYPWASPEYYHLFHDSFMLYRDNGLCKWTKFNPGSVNGGVSSGNAALELAYLLGCKNITLTGIDLCFIDDKTHIAGTEVEFDIQKSKDKWTKIPGNAGNEVTTIPVWYRCLNEYLISIQKHRDKGAKLFNTSLKGAKIMGAEVQPWSELSQVYNKEIDVKTRIEEKRTKHKEGAWDDYQNQKSFLRKLLSSFVKEYGKTKSFIQDNMLTSKREEEKAVGKLKNIYEPTDFFNQVEGTKKSLVEVYSESCRMVDQLKQKFFTQELFSLSLIDICQHSYFQVENRCGNIRNTVVHDHERLKQYVIVNMHFLDELNYYAIKLLDLLNGKIDQFEEYKYEPTGGSET